MISVDRIRNKKECITSGRCAPEEGSPAGVALRTFVSDRCGATGFSTGTAAFDGGAELPYHTHDCSEAVTILDGHAQILIEGRAYRLSALDCVHIPAGTAHSVRNADAKNAMIAHWAFGTAKPERHFVTREFRFEDHGADDPEASDPEHINRFVNAELYELSEGALFCDLFASRFGAVGICGGYGRFTAGSSLPCHFHEYDESITITGGEAICLVQGSEYRLSGCDTAFVPKPRTHRFLNNSDSDMEMIWVYAGNEPDRTIVDAGYCSGSLLWPA